MGLSWLWLHSSGQVMALAVCPSWAALAWLDSLPTRLPRPSCVPTRVAMALGACTWACHGLNCVPMLTCHGLGNVHTDMPWPWLCAHQGLP